MKLLDLRLGEIVRDEKQPRVDFIGLDELAASIAEHGVLQPILVRQVADKFVIIAGERRWRASKMAGKETIPALAAAPESVSDDAGRLDEASVLVLALTENLQRENLTGPEIAKSLALLRDKFGIPPQDLAKRIGKSESTVSKLLALVEPDNQADLRVCGKSDSGAGVADTLAKFRSLPRPAQAALRQYSSKTGVTYSENDINKFKEFEAAGNKVLESNVDAVLSCTLRELEGRARDFKAAKRDVPVAVAITLPPASAPALASAGTEEGGWSTEPVLDPGEINVSTFFEDPTRAATGATAVPANVQADFDGFLNPPPPAVEITPLDLTGVVLTGKQVKALLALLGADSEVNPLFAHNLLLTSLRKL